MTELRESVTVRQTSVSRLRSESKARPAPEAKSRDSVRLPKASNESPGMRHKIYLYRLKSLSIDQPNQVLASVYFDHITLHASDDDHGLLLSTSAGMAGFKYVENRSQCSGSR